MKKKVVPLVSRVLSMGRGEEAEPKRRRSLDGKRRKSFSERLDSRLEQELAGYDEHEVVVDGRCWTVQVNGDSFRIDIPEGYPFRGPVVRYKGYTVHFLMGSHHRHDEDSRTLQATWTPAKRIADAVETTQDVVRRALLEDDASSVLQSKTSLSQ